MTYDFSSGWGVLVTDCRVLLSATFFEKFFCLDFGKVPTQDKLAHGDVPASISINVPKPQKSGMEQSIH